MSDAVPPTKDPSETPAPLSLARLRAAFARMVSGPADEAESDPSEPTPGMEDDAVTPEGVIEAILFVGDAEGAPIPAESLAEGIRGVSPEDVPDLVARLNARYEQDGAACRIERVAEGYRFTLADGLERMADRLRGRVRASRLSQASLETLSVVAYRQPIDADAVEQLRGVRSGPALTQLVRRGLIRVDGPGYVTTDRFLRVMRLASLGELPRMAELDD